MPPAATQQQWVTPLQAALTQAGVATSDADCLAASYPQADPAEFVAGLDWLATLYVNQAVPQAALPTCEPWAALAAQLHQAPPGDFDDVFVTATAHESPALQMALTNAWLSRAQTLQQKINQQVTRKRKVKSAEYLQVLADLGYAFRMNVLNDTVEVQVGPEWQAISDPLAAKIRRQIRDKGFEFVNVMEDAYIAEAYDNRYHPIQQYLDGLQYDGGDYIAQLANHFTDKDNVFPTFLRRWLIGAVARARTAVQNRILVLDGAQGLGKSEFVKWLGSVLPAYYLESAIAPEDKDCWIRLASKWIWEVSEFGSTTRKADRDSLKFFLSMNTVTVRKAYGRFDMIKPTLASFIGTFNREGGVLNDPTGSRRFMICNLTRIAWNYTSIDPNQVWAEANAAYLTGEPWHLTPDEARQANAINEQYEIDDPMEGLLKRYFRINPSNPYSWVATDQIVTTLETNGLRGGSTRQNGMALASLMTKLNCERVRKTNQNGQRVWAYQGVETI